MNTHPYGLIGLLPIYLITCALYILSCVSAYITFRGVALVMEAEYSGWEQRAAAAMFGLAVWVTIYVLWYLAFVMIPQSGRTRIFATGLVGLICVMVLSMSTWLGAAGLAGGAAQTHHMRQTVKAFEASLQERFARTQQLHNLLPLLEGNTVAYRKMAENERLRGTITGYPGSGTVEQTLDRIAGEMEAMSASVKRMTDNSPKLEENARTELTAMRSVIDETVHVSVRLRSFAGHATNLRSGLAQLDISGTVSAGERVLDSLREAADKQGVSARSAHLAKAQRQALADLSRQINATADTLHNVMSDIAGDGPGAIPEGAALTATEAVFRYFFAYAPFWAAAFSLDFTALVTLLFLILARLQKTASFNRENVHVLHRRD